MDIKYDKGEWGLMCNLDIQRYILVFWGKKVAFEHEKKEARTVF